MISPLIDLLILAGVALFVLSRLYMALGRDDGERIEQPKPRGSVAPVPSDDVDAPRAEDLFQHGPVFTGPAASGLEDIYNMDNGFDEAAFMRGAKQAYQMIVGAFARGDKDELRPLLDDDVYEAWTDAIDARATGGEDPFNLLRIRRSEIENAELDGTMARIMIRYEAELGDGERTRTAREVWTYMRDLSTGDPNWLLDDVEVAN